MLEAKMAMVAVDKPERLAKALYLFYVFPEALQRVLPVKSLAPLNLVTHTYYNSHLLIYTYLNLNMLAYTC